MLRRISEPLALSEASLLVLRPALNAPVLNVEFMPVGPARAAVVAFAEEYGGMGFALGIRSVESGQVVVFRNREALDETEILAEALEPVLATAERMGFLFDEDMLGDSASGDARAQALGLWGRLMGEVETPAPKTVPTRPSAAQPVLELELEQEIVPTPAAAPQAASELVLEEVAAPASPPPAVPRPARQPALRDKSAAVETPPAAAPGQDRPSKPAPAPTQVTALSKFRATPESKTSSTSVDDPAPALGRVPLVRVRRGRGESKRPPFLARLLSSF